MLWSSCWIWFMASVEHERRGRDRLMGEHRTSIVPMVVTASRASAVFSMGWAEFNPKREQKCVRSVAVPRNQTSRTLNPSSFNHSASVRRRSNLRDWVAFSGFVYQRSTIRPLATGEHRGVESARRLFFGLRKERRPYESKPALD